MHVNFWIALPIAGLFCALWGIIIGAPTLRLKSDYLALVTLGFGEIIPEFFKNGDDSAFAIQPDQRHPRASRRSTRSRWGRWS